MTVEEKAVIGSRNQGFELSELVGKKVKDVVVINNDRLGSHKVRFYFEDGSRLESVTDSLIGCLGLSLKYRTGQRELKINRY